MKSTLCILYLSLSIFVVRANFNKHSSSFSFQHRLTKSLGASKLSADDGGMYIGFSSLYYFYGLTPLDIYKSDINRAGTTKNTFGNTNFAPGILVGAFTGNIVGLEWSRNVVRTNAEYERLNGSGTYAPVQDKIKIVNSQLKFKFSLPLSTKNHLKIGTSIDVGIFKTKQKFIGDGFSGKWAPFYYTFSIFKSGPVSSTPTAGISLFLTYNTKFLRFAISRQFMLMDADLNGYSGNDVFFNTQNYQFTIAYVL